MALVVFQRVCKQFGTQVVLDDVSLEFHAGQTVGLVGVNGAGKTTVFRLVTGECRPDTGTVTVAGGVPIGYLRQEPEMEGDATLHDFVGSVFDELLAMERRMQTLSEEIAARHEDPSLPHLMAQYDRLHSQFLTAGGETFENRLDEILHGLGFTKEEYVRPMSLLSGGQRCRAALAKLLLSDSSLLLLDEPTNHLDIDAVRWLEKFLAAHRGGAVVISHDRYLLDRVCQRIVEMAGRQVHSYPGNYSNYVESKARADLTRGRELEKHSEFIAKERAYIAKHLAGQRSQQAKGRRTRLERQLRDGKLVTEGPRSTRRALIAFRGREQGDAEVLRCEDLSMGFGEVILFRGLGFRVRKGQRFGITGPNGTGKTTLLRGLAGELSPLEGRIEFERNLRIGYYAQDAGGLTAERTVVDEIRSERSDWSERDARSYLARFLFRGDEVFKPVGALSGGEQSRVRLAKLILSQPDILILDEPTNHLDIPSREALEESLTEFGGTVIAVSHDRYFLDRIVDHLLVLRREGHALYEGSYSDYLEQLEREASVQNRPPKADKGAAQRSGGPKKPSRTGAPPRPKSTTSAYDRLSIEQLEKMVMEREVQLAALHERFGNAEVYKDPEGRAELEEEMEGLSAELAALDAAWRERVDSQG